MPTRKLNAGCGRDVRPGWVNLDRRPLPGVDVVHDLESLPLPFESGEFDEILSRDVLEHVDFPPLLGEFHRILIEGGVLRARVPHFSCANAYKDPTHRRPFSVGSFDFFVEGSPEREDSSFDFAFASMRLRRVTFQKGIYLYNHAVEAAVNLAPLIQEIWEATLWSRIFPGENVEVELVK